MTWNDYWYAIRMLWALWIPHWRRITGNCQCEFCTLNAEWRQNVDKAQQERVAALQQEAHDDYHSPKAVEARESLDRRARDHYRHELKDDE